MQDTYERRIIHPFVVNLVEKFIDRQGYKTRIQLSNLNDDEISDFTALMLGDPQMDPSFILDNYEEFLPALRAALKSRIDWEGGSLEEDKIILSEKIMTLCINHFSHEMENILIETHQNLLTDYLETNNITVKKDSETGEIYW